MCRHVHIDDVVAATQQAERSAESCQRSILSPNGRRAGAKIRHTSGRNERKCTFLDGRIFDMLFVVFYRFGGHENALLIFVMSFKILFGYMCDLFVVRYIILA